MGKLGKRFLPLLLALLLLLAASSLALAEALGEVTAIQGGGYRAAVSGADFAAGDQIVLLVLAGNRSAGVGSFGADDIMYIDQKAAATNGAISFDFIPRASRGATVFITGGNLSAPFCVGSYAGQGVAVKGLVVSHNPQQAVQINLYAPGAQYASATPLYSTVIAAEATGFGQVSRDFTLEGVASGSYDLVVSKPCHVDYVITGMEVAAADLDLTAHANAKISGITLPVGDVNGDNWVNYLDLADLVHPTNYGRQALSEAAKLLDLNGDGWVNYLDLSDLIHPTNYGSTVVRVGY